MKEINLQSLMQRSVIFFVDRSLLLLGRFDNLSLVYGVF